MTTDIYKIIFSGCNEMSKIKAILDQIATIDITVVIRGEVGTGKELMARFIHLISNRKDKPFVKVDFPWIPKESLSSEFFGFEKNVLKGGPFQVQGKVKFLDCGTILLKDIENLDISAQPKLLELFRDNTFSHSGIPVEKVNSVAPRLILTIKDQSEESAKERHFYDNLFSKIHFISITVPPLRDRKEQISSLSQYYFDFYKGKYASDVSPFSIEIMDAFREYDWPGNIDELESMVKRIVISGDGDTVLRRILSSGVDGRAGLGSYENSSVNSSTEKKLSNLKDMKKKVSEAAEVEMIKKALEETHWNRRRTAKLLGISYNGLLYKIQNYNLI